MIKIKAPFVYFGGKSKVAPLIWQRFGDCDNYIEPFAGSLAVLLGRPSPPRIETVNDINAYVSNFWRATQNDPEAVVEHCDWPVSEVDLHARHRWLVLSPEAQAFRERMRTEPDYYDCKVAGWWVWGINCWIGSGWCEESRAQSSQIPYMGGTNNRGSAGRGIHANIPDSHRPQLADAYGLGRGVHASGPTGKLWQQRPALSGGGKPGNLGMGVHANYNAGTCAERRAWLLDWFGRLRDRLRVVRVCCGHWRRVCDSPSVTTRLGVTGLFLDPPYPTHQGDGSKSRDASLYASDAECDTDKIRDEVLAYCRERGQDPLMRICVAGYDTDGYAALVSEGWTEVAWKGSGGYGNRSNEAEGNANAARERLWFNKSCLNPDGRGLPLFAGMEEDE